MGISLIHSCASLIQVKIHPLLSVWPGLYLKPVRHRPHQPIPVQSLRRRHGEKGKGLPFFFVLLPLAARHRVGPQNVVFTIGAGHYPGSPSRSFLQAGGTRLFERGVPCTRYVANGSIAMPRHTMHCRNACRAAHSHRSFKRLCFSRSLGGVGF